MTDIILPTHQALQVKEALLAGLEVAGVASSKATHYHKSAEQREAVQENVKKLYSISKELPLLIAAQSGANGFYVQEALLHEFKKTVHGGRNLIVSPKDWDDERLRDNAVYAGFRQLQNAGTPYILRMLASLKERKINNARSRRFALSFIFGHDNLEFIAVKYRAKLRKILTHCWGKKMTGAMLAIAEKALLSGTTNEKETSIENRLMGQYGLNDAANASHGLAYLEGIVLYVFGRGKPELYSQSLFPIIHQVYQAQADITGLNLVPEEILTGMLSNPNHPQHAELWGDKEKQAKTLEQIRNTSKVETANQAVRKTKQEKEKKIVREKPQANIVAEADDPIAVVKTGFQTGFNEDIIRRIRELAEKHAYKDFPYQKIGIILDRSVSMDGHFRESAKTPEAHALFMRSVLEASADRGLLEVIDGYHTDVARAFLTMLQRYDEVGEQPEAVFIISDGYENSYDGLFSEVLEAWQKLTGNAIPVYHISPIGSAETNARARSLGKNVVSMSANYKSLGMQMQANLLAADVRLWLQAAVNRLGDGREIHNGQAV